MAEDERAADACAGYVELPERPSGPGGTDAPPAPASDAGSTSIDGNKPVKSLNKRPQSRKRQRRVPLPVPVSPPPLSVSSNRHHQHDWHDDQPDLPHFGQLLGALLLTTGLSLFSALDAKESCLRHETLAMLELVDDDNFQKAYNVAVVEEKCVAMFQNVLLPMGAVTYLLGVLAFLLLYCYHRRAESSPTSSLQLTSQLLVLALGVLGIQTYSVTSIMLKPRTAEDSDNPYTSLAAVDRYGYVGLNANLYYLSWLSEGIALALVYQLATAAVRLMAHAAPSTVALLRATSWDTSELESRAMWYQSIYRLRFRTGIWVAALLSCLVIVASSNNVWNQVVWPYAKVYSVSDDDLQVQNFVGQLRYTQVCQMVAEGGGSAKRCRRTVAAWLAGIIASALCATAIGMHLTARQSAHEALHQQQTAWNSPIWEQVFVQNRLPLRTELVLSILLSLLLGFNAVFCTGVMGPAATVGNLYYASWFSFLLCVRICLGCIEESYDLSEQETAQRHGYQVSDDHHDDESDANKGSEWEEHQLKRVRLYFFNCIFCVVAAASAYDAAVNQKNKLSRLQKYVIFSPCAVASLSAVLFAVCLSKRCYATVSKFWFGGLLSVAAFWLCLGDLVVVMHSEDSWAVNGIGEIEMANLYYFSWASILSAGLQMMSYVKGLVKSESDDFMSIVWLAICKVCFVILGAALHIWATIAHNCEFDEITSGAVTFCSRTVLAMVVSLAGMLVGGLIVLARLVQRVCRSCRCKRVQAHVEMLISMFLVLLFAAAVALITGIGGPGQSVGDLFYSTWVAFFVSLGIFVHCEQEVRRQKLGSDPSETAPTRPGSAIRSIRSESAVLV